MKAAFALLADRETANLVRQVAWDVHWELATGIGAQRLPPHVSLKQPFDAPDKPDPLVAYTRELARSLPPTIPIELNGLKVLRGPVLVFDLAETDLLRGLHDRLNRELPSIVGNPATADFDGPRYRFHLTITNGGATQEALEAACQRRAGAGLGMTVTAASEIGLFVYDAKPEGGAEFLPYLVRPLG